LRRRPLPDRAPDLTAEEDAAVGRDTYVRLQRLTDRIARRHGLARERVVDFVLLGSLFLAADTNDTSIDEAVELLRELARSVQEDDLPPATRH
jgi:hypothetical protein